jgi:signal transduction histidine kinase
MGRAGRWERGSGRLAPSLGLLPLLLAGGWAATIRPRIAYLIGAALVLIAGAGWLTAALLWRRRRACARFHDRVARFLDSLDEGYLCLGGDGVLRAYNARARALLDIPRGAQEKGLTYRMLWNESEPPGRLEALISGGGRSEPEEISITLHSGRRLHLLIRRVDPLEETPGEPMIGLLFSDRSEMLRWQERAGLADRLAALGRISSTITHEIRNPLSAMKINAQLLRERLVKLLPDARFGEVVKYLDVLQDEVQRLHNFLDTFTQLAARRALQIQWVSAEEIVRELIELIKPEARSRGVELVVKLGPALPKFRGDPNAIRQVLMNLINNAMVAMKDGGTLTLSVRHDVAKDILQIDVADTGEGIPPKVLPHIFELYFTTRKKGTGIGLSIALDIVQQHKGTIHVESEVGRGTTFHIELPVLGTWKDDPADSRQRTRWSGT